MGEAASRTRQLRRRSEHAFFERGLRLKGARFALTEDGSTAAFHVELGTLVASLPLGTVRREFEIDRECPDDVLLKIVEKSLRFIKESVRQIDPRELLDGSASWSVEDRHRTRAKASSLGEGDRQRRNHGRCRQVLEAFLRASGDQDQAGCSPRRRSQRGSADRSMPKRCCRGSDVFARELAYTEALQERCGEVMAIVPKSTNWRAFIAATARIVDELSRIRTLLLKPIELYDGIFARLNNRLSDVGGAIIAVSRPGRPYPRTARRYSSKHDAVGSDLGGVERDRNDPLHRERDQDHRLYRFIARHFLTSQAWQQGAARRDPSLRSIAFGTRGLCPILGQWISRFTAFSSSRWSRRSPRRCDLPSRRCRRARHQDRASRGRLRALLRSRRARPKQPISSGSTAARNRSFSISKQPRIARCWSACSPAPMCSCRISARARRHARASHPRNYAALPAPDHLLDQRLWRGRALPRHESL